jgi:MFS transporter, SHS family, lactate transporter
MVPFLECECGLTPHPVATITLISNVGAIIGGVLIGYWSDLVGRRRAMAFATLLATLHRA